MSETNKLQFEMELRIHGHIHTPNPGKRANLNLNLCCRKQNPKPLPEAAMSERAHAQSLKHRQVGPGLTPWPVPHAIVSYSPGQRATCSPYFAAVLL